MWKEFREFIMRGNVLDLAVAVIIGAAFTAIVSSLVNDIITPLIGVITGGINFSGLSVQVGQASVAYGKFIQAVINFLIVALVIFLLVRGVNRVQRKFSDPTSPDPAPPPEDIRLLREIRDLLKQRPM
jgi:large conductance mechanosensitive channel